MRIAQAAHSNLSPSETAALGRNEHLGHPAGALVSRVFRISEHAGNPEAMPFAADFVESQVRATRDCRRGRLQAHLTQGALEASWNTLIKDARKEPCRTARDEHGVARDLDVANVRNAPLCGQLSLPSRGPTGRARTK